MAVEAGTSPSSFYALFSSRDAVRAAEMREVADPIRYRIEELVTAHMMSTISPGSTWAPRVHNLIMTELVGLPMRSAQDMGFPGSSRFVVKESVASLA